MENYYDILIEDEVIKNDNRIVPQMASDIRLKELQNEYNTLRESEMVKDKRLTTVVKENTVLKRKITEIEEGLDMERKNLKALECFLAADYAQRGRKNEEKKQLTCRENSEIEDTQVLVSQRIACYYYNELVNLENDMKKLKNKLARNKQKIALLKEEIENTKEKWRTKNNNQKHHFVKHTEELEDETTRFNCL